jgi:DNA-binding MarR family transcriptional regulator
VAESSYSDENLAYIRGHLERIEQFDELVTITKLSQSTVSRICKHLLDFGLILTTRNPKQSRVSLYAQTELERLLGVSKIARRIITG